MSKSLLKTLILFSFSAILNFGCISFEPNNENCEESHDWGKVYVSDTTKAFLKPYEGKSKVIFKDSLDNEIVFSISKSVTFQPWMYNIPIHKECSKEVNITSENEFINIDLICNNTSLNLYYHAASSLFIDSRYSTDEDLLVRNNENKIIFLQDIIKDSKVLTGAYFKTKTVELLGKSYKNVIANDNNCYIDSSHGILAFRDLDKKLWFFDRFK